LTYSCNTITLTSGTSAPYVVTNSNATTGIPNSSKFVIQGFKATTNPDNVAGVLSVYAEQGITDWKTIMRTRHTGGSLSATYTIYYYGLS
jgi:hypothetical protein